jgi:hypothetical protein
MTKIADSAVSIQTSSQLVPSTPSWLGEVTLICYQLKRQGVLGALAEQVRFARRRFGRYEVLDFLAALIGYAISGERTLEAFYERLHPFAAIFMGLFGRDRLPERSTLSRFLSALTPEPVEALRTLFLADLLARKLPREAHPGGLWDRRGIPGSSSMSMARARPPGNAPCPRRRIGLPPSATCVPSVPPATLGASGGRLSAPARRSCKRTRTSGSARSATRAMESTGPNCAGRWQR